MFLNIDYLCLYIIINVVSLFYFIFSSSIPISSHDTTLTFCFIFVPSNGMYKYYISQMKNSKEKGYRKTLKDFKSPLRTCKLFNDACGKLPQFLNQNLQDQARTVKLFREDEEAYIKIFYFQFMKLCFQAEDVDYDTKINKFIQTIEKNVNLLEVSPRYAPHIVDGEHLKDIIFEFLELVSECKEPVELTLARYLIIGDIFTHFLTNYLVFYHKILKSQFNTKASIKILSQYFEVDIVDYDECIQYTDAQVYSYKNNQSEIYLIFIDEQKAKRNAILQNTQFGNFNSNKSLQPDQCQVIKFQTPDIVFEQSQVAVDLGLLGNAAPKMQKDKTVFIAEVQNIGEADPVANQCDQSGVNKKMLKTDFISTNKSSNNQSVVQSEQDIQKQCLQIKKQIAQIEKIQVLKQDALTQMTNKKDKQKINCPSQSIQALQPKQRLSMLQKPRSSKLKQLFVIQNKQNLPCAPLNLTKQFTDTFILDNIVVEPYRSKIKQLKVKARQQRKSKQPYFI